MLEGKWKDMVWPASESAVHYPSTGVSTDVLRHIGKKSVEIPAKFVSVDGSIRLYYIG